MAYPFLFVSDISEVECPSVDMESPSFFSGDRRMGPSWKEEGFMVVVENHFTFFLIVV